MPVSPGASGMQPRGPCRPWRGTLASGHKPRCGLLALQSLESNPQLSFATRMEDWTCLGQHKRQPEFPVVTRESRCNSRKTTWLPRHRKMKPFPATAPQEKSHVRNWRSKGHLAPWMRPTKFPEIPVSLERNTEVFRHPLLGALSPLLIWTGGSTPLLCLEGVPDLPVAPQEDRKSRVAEPIGRARPPAPHRHRDRPTAKSPKRRLVGLVVAQVDGQRRRAPEGAGEPFAHQDHGPGFSPADPGSQFEHLLSPEHLQARSVPNSLGEQVLKRWNDRRIGEPVMEAHGQAFRLHQHAREATCPISEKPLGLPGDGKNLDDPGMAEAEASPRDIETVAARVRGARDANEAFDVAETPAGDDPDARLRVTGKTAQEAARSLGKTRG